MSQQKIKERDPVLAKEIAELKAIVDAGLSLPDEEWLAQSGPFGSKEKFLRSAFEYFYHLRVLTKVSPSHRVLDYGCGLARLAFPFSAYLDPERGSYTGVDIDASCIAHNRSVFDSYANIDFHHADIYNKMYNRTGKPTHILRDLDVGGPFDLIFLFSVFTHILPEDCDTVLEFLIRRMSDHGELLSSWFLLNDGAREAIAAGVSSRKFAHPYGEAMTDTPKLPEGAIAYEEDKVRERFQRAGFKDVEIHYGLWRGNVDSMVWQDVVIVRR